MSEGPRTETEHCLILVRARSGIMIMPFLWSRSGQGLVLWSCPSSGQGLVKVWYYDHALQA